MKSDFVKKGTERAPHRSLFNAAGYTDEELERPLIGVVNSFNEIVPGHMNLDKICEAILMNKDENNNISVYEAIRIIKANQGNDFIETILLDLNMPKVDGFAVLEFMRDNNLFTHMPVSIISGDSTKETIDRAFTYQIVDMVSKPFNEQSIKMVIEKTLIYKDMV